MSCKVLKLENEHLRDDNCFLSTLINVSENIFIENNLMVLERHNDIISIELENIFLNNYIRCPTLDPNVDKQYFAESCNDLKPLIKTLAWKDTRFLVTRSHRVKNVLAQMYLDMQKDITVNAYVNEDTQILNIWNPRNWGIKFQENNKGFGVYKGRIMFFNHEQFSEKGTQNEVNELMTLMRNCVYGL